MKAHVFPSVVLVNVVLVLLLIPSATMAAPLVPDPGTAPSEQKTLKAVADVMIGSATPSMNWGDWDNMTAGYGGVLGKRPSLVLFDLSSIPSGAQVDKATLQVYYFLQSYSPNPLPMKLTAHRVTDSWTEMGATWNNCSGASGEQYGSIDLPARSTYGGEWVSLDVTELVRAWTAGTHNNYGIMLRGDEGPPENYKYFRTKESDESGYEARLIVDLRGNGGEGKVWNGGHSTDWHTAANWTPSGVPAMTDDVTIPDVANDPVIANNDAAAKDLTIHAGAVLDLTSRELTVEGTLTNDGALEQAHNASLGATTQYLRITNKAGTQTKYSGVDVTPAGSPAEYVPNAKGVLRPPAYDGPMIALPGMVRKGPDGAAMAVVPMPLPLEQAPEDTEGTKTLKSEDDATVIQGFASTNFGKTADMWAGYDTSAGGKIVRSLVKFPVEDLPSGKRIQKATLRVHLVTSYDSSGARISIKTHRIDENWSESKVNWSNQPNHDSSVEDSQSVTHADWGWSEFDVTDLVQGWYDGTYDNHGLMLRGPESSSNPGWRGFGTREAPSSYRPKLVVDYETYNAPPSIAGIPNVEIPMNGSDPKAVDLWDYASDAEDDTDQLKYRIANSPEARAGIDLKSNRYISVEPDAGWAGSTLVEVEVEDRGGKTDQDTFRVTVKGPGTMVKVAVSGNQRCGKRSAGVLRCYDVESDDPLTATVRFYFREAERVGLPLNDLEVYHGNGQWTREPGPFARGGGGEALYVEAQNVDDFSPFALDVGRSAIYLPVIIR